MFWDLAIGVATAAIKMAAAFSISSCSLTKKTHYRILLLVLILNASKRLSFCIYFIGFGWLLRIPVLLQSEHLTETGGKLFFCPVISDQTVLSYIAGFFQKRYSDSL